MGPALAGPVVGVGDASAGGRGRGGGPGLDRAGPDDVCHQQGRGLDIPSQFLVMLPYIATIVVLVLISRNAAWIKANMPASLGKPFSPGG